MGRGLDRPRAYIDEGGLLMLASAPELAQSWADLCASVLTETGAGLATSDHALLCVCGVLERHSTPRLLRSFLSDSEPFLDEITPVRMTDLIRATDIAEEHGLEFRLALNAAIALHRGYSNFVSPESEYDRIASLRRRQP